MTQLEFGELVNKQLSRLEQSPFFLLETQFNSRSKNLEYTLYYYPESSMKQLQDFQPEYFRAKGYISTTTLLASLTDAIDKFLAGTREDITIE